MCKNTANITLACEYQKMVGVAKMDGGSRSESRESSTELSHTMGVSATIGAEYELQTPITRKMAYAEITTSFEHSWGSSNTWTQESETIFEKSAKEETSYKAKFPVAMGKTISMCQPQGWVGN